MFILLILNFRESIEIFTYLFWGSNAAVLRIFLALYPEITPCGVQGTIKPIPATGKICMHPHPTNYHSFPHIFIFNDKHLKHVVIHYLINSTFNRE